MATQKDAAAHIDISTQRFRELQKKGVLPPTKGPGGYDIDACRVSYIRHLRGLASGQHSASAEALDLTAERARKEKSQADKVEFELSIAKREYAPVSVLNDIMGGQITAWVAAFDAYTSSFSSQFPEIEGKLQKRVLQSIVQLRHDIADAEVTY